MTKFLPPFSMILIGKNILSSPMMRKPLFVEAVMEESIRPALANDGGGLEVIEVDGPIVRIRYQGACGGCPSSTGGTLRVIENHLKSQLDPEIKVHTYT